MYVPSEKSSWRDVLFRRVCDYEMLTWTNEKGSNQARVSIFSKILIDILVCYNGSGVTGATRLKFMNDLGHCGKITRKDKETVP